MNTLCNNSWLPRGAFFILPSYFLAVVLHPFPSICPGPSPITAVGIIALPAAVATPMTTLVKKRMENYMNTTSSYLTYLAS